MHTYSSRKETTGWLAAKIILVLASLIILLVASYNVDGDPEVHEGWQIWIAVFSIAWLGIFLACSYQCHRTAYLVTTAYIIALSMFHLGITVPDAFGLFKDFGFREGRSFDRWLERAGWYTVLALASIGIGFGLSIRKKVDVVVEPVLRMRALTIAFWDGVGLFVAAMLFLVVAIKSFGNLLSYSRAEFFWGHGDSRGLGMFLMTFPSSITLLVIGANTKSQKLFAIIVGTIALALMLLSGYRSAVFFPLLFGFVLWVKSGRRAPTGVAVGVIAFALIAIPAISMIRSTGPYMAITSDKVQESLAESDAKETFRTTGQTLGVLAHVLRLVPAQDPFRYGMTYVMALRNSIPNVLPEMSDSGHTEALKQSAMDPKAITSTMPSDWITYRIARDKFDKGEGVGFSGVGEPYLNFGYFGVVAFFVCVGFVLGRIDSTNLLMHPTLLVALAALLWTLGRTVRNDFSNLIKPAVFMLIILVIWRLCARLVPALRKAYR